MSLTGEPAPPTRAGRGAARTWLVEEPVEGVHLRRGVRRLGPAQVGPPVDRAVVPGLAGGARVLELALPGAALRHARAVR